MGKERRSGLRCIVFSLALLLGQAASEVQAGELHLLTYGAPSILGTQGNRHSDVGRFGVSDDGRYVVFSSAANNLIADDHGELADVYLSDLQTGSLTRISRRPDGGEPNGGSFAAAISADGRWIAYASHATDIVPTAAAQCHAFGACGAYLFDRQSGQTQLLTPPLLPSSTSLAAEIRGVVPSADGEMDLN
ncbi:MAG: PD40 domain-containing protein [Rhodanobacteraceae bacterium]|nr:PD40 domain-containing protein [Rhodanobacteraceae bacterium]